MSSMLEEAKDSPLNRFGDDAHQSKLTRSILVKLDTRYVSWPELESQPPFFATVLTRTNAPFRILPMLALLFLCSFLDRTNVGNAKIYGLEKDINITDSQYDIGLTVFYLTYVCR